jgi:hypothetical protein
MAVTAKQAGIALRSLCEEIDMPVTGIAAVAHGFHQPLCVEEVSFRDPEPNEVLVRVNASVGLPPGDESF